MAEKEQLHRHRMEAEEADHDRRLERRGLSWGGTLTLAGMIIAAGCLLAVMYLGATLVMSGHEVGGYAALATAVGTIIAVFVKSHLNKRERASGSLEKRSESDR